MIIWLENKLSFHAKPKPRLFIQCCVQDPSDLEAHVEYLCSGSSLALCLEGENAVRRLLDVLRQEDSSLRTTCYGTAHSYNGIYGECPGLHAGTRSRTGLLCTPQHEYKLSCFKCTFKMLLTNPIASGSYEKAIQDVKRFFPEGLCCTETSTMRQEQVCRSHTWLGTWVVSLTDKCQTLCLCLVSCF